MLRVHGINATSVTAHKPPFPYSRITLLISIRLSITKFLLDQRVDQDGMIQLIDRSIEHEHDHEKQPEQNHAPKWPFGDF
jgi:hypothetical protein